MARDKLFVRISALVLTAAAILFAGCVTADPTESDESESIAEAEQGITEGSFCLTQFYTDDSYTSIVGRCRVNCSGGWWCSGTITSYGIEDCTPCD
jgi:hypothetical protein